jgi:hypothetical protein
MDVEEAESYSLHFGPVTGVAAWKAHNGDIKKVKEVKNVKFLWMQLDCVPRESEILGGTAVVVINGKIQLSFRVLQQFPQVQGVISGVIIATNAPDLR